MDDDDFQGFPDRGELSRRSSDETINSGMYPDFWSQLQGTPIQSQTMREQTFYEKILPGLNCFAMLEDSHLEDQGMQNELDNIDPFLFVDKKEIETSPQQFFNFIEQQDAYEQLKNKKIGTFRLPRQNLGERVQGLLRAKLSGAHSQQVVRVCRQYRAGGKNRELPYGRNRVQ